MHNMSVLTMNSLELVHDDVYHMLHIHPRTMSRRKCDVRVLRVDEGPRSIPLAPLPQSAFLLRRAQLPTSSTTQRSVPGRGSASKPLPPKRAPPVPTRQMTEFFREPSCATDYIIYRFKRKYSFRLPKIL